MLAEALEKNLSCPVERKKALNRLTTLGVGGYAECYVEPTNLNDFRALYHMSAREGFLIHILGGGSNVLFPDGMVRGVVLSTRRWASASWQAHDVELQVGYSLPALVSEAVRRGLGGLEFAVGIPGTVGGAMAGNAGAGGWGLSDLLTEVTTLEADGSLRVWHHGEFTSSYRRFSLTEGRRLFLSCRITLSSCPQEEIEVKLERFRSQRVAQPIGYQSAGCSFKNPTGDSAGRILDQCGCKGMTLGDAVVSQRHANFILNRGRASASDVLGLIKACRERAFDSAGVHLEPEIKFLGFGQDSPFADDEAQG